MSRREFSPKVKLAAFQRANGRCEGDDCGGRLTVGKFHYDHRIPDAMGGEPILENCEVLCVGCHSKKTRQGDIPTIAKVKRLELRHAGIKGPSSFRKPPPGFKHDWKRGGLKRIET